MAFGTGTQCARGTSASDLACQKWCAGNVQINLGPRLLTPGSQLTRFVSADPIKSEIIRL